MTAHGLNLGHGHCKYIIIDSNGNEEVMAPFPSQIAPAGRAVAGSLGNAQIVQIDGRQYWYGEDAQLATSPITMLVQQRLIDPTFLPVLVKGALQRIGITNGTHAGPCVTCLPGSWAFNKDKGLELGGRLREGADGIYTRINVIPEPLGILFAELLDTHGKKVGDTSLQHGRVGIIDIGLHTLDVAMITRLNPEPEAMQTWNLGTARALSTIQSHLNAHFDISMNLYQTDMAVRDQTLMLAGTCVELPTGWDRPLIDLGESIGSRLYETWGNGKQVDTILIGGGGAELLVLTNAIQRRYPHAIIVHEPQMAIARGCARRARLMAIQQK